MGKQILVLTLIIILGQLRIRAQDIVNINLDEKTLEQLMLNTATQEATNALHNIQVDSIKKKQSKLMTLISGIAAEKELLIQTYENVKGFKQESRYYLSMVTTGKSIIDHSAEAVEVLNKSKFPGKARAALGVSNLVSQAIGLGKAFADIVANSTVPNPIKHPDATSGDKEKYNLLNRYERLRMANDILFRLRRIDSSLCYLIYICKNSGWGELLFQLDRETYITYIMTKVNTNELIGKWERIKK